jgi:hypothetical protein
MNLKTFLVVLAGGAIAFIWSSISWMAIPWHKPTMKGFENPAAISQAIKDASPEPGIYIYPAWTDDADDMKEKHMEGPYVFASILPGGVGDGMGKMMLVGFLANLVGAALLLTLIMTVPDRGWKARALVGAVAALFVSLVPALMDYNWWHFPVGFTLVAIGDGFIGWTLVALVMAKMSTRG